MAGKLPRGRVWGEGRSWLNWLNRILAEGMPGIRHHRGRVRTRSLIRYWGVIRCGVWGILAQLTWRDPCQNQRRPRWTQKSRSWDPDEKELRRAWSEFSQRETLCYYCKRDRLGKRQFAHWPLHVQLCSTHRYSGLSILLFCTGFFPPSCTYAFFPPLAYLSEKGRREII